MSSVDVLNEILRWSEDRPAWQRDALRRLVTQGELKESDIADIAALCKASHGLADKVKPEVLDAEHLPQPSIATTPVALKSLTHRSGVNALAPDQTIAFGPTLTVVYGANAAGKSGYTRILKRACRARGAEEILGNVVSGGAPGRPSATITFTVEEDTHELPWDDDQPPNRFLSRVSVFDRHCASVYVAEQTDVAFRPLGLDLFDRLSDACEAVRRRLELDRRELETGTILLPSVAEGTAVHELLSHITSLTSPEEVKKLASISSDEIAGIEDRRKRLRDLQSDDPQKAARELEIRAKRVEALSDRVRAISEALADEPLAKVFALREQVAEARRAAEEMRRATFEQQPLPNTGSDTWREMWAAAERFSTTDAYPDDSFPVTHASARCVLCQQQLRDGGGDRFTQFHAFLVSEVQRRRDELSAEYQAARSLLHSLVPMDESASETLDELQLEDGELADAAHAYLEAAQNRRLAAMNGVGEGGSSISAVPVLPPHPDGLAEKARALRQRADELRGANRSEAVNRVASELRELESRQVLVHNLGAVLAEIERKKRLAAYQLCLDETRTTAITRKSTEVTTRTVTEQLAEAFKRELEQLSFRHVEVEMVAAGGSRGALYHKLQLRRAPGVSVPKVVSEGEARCLSIASFFAELSTAADRSAILFDDPVSSLDHHWRTGVAGRLVAEAKVRQVVVFTHDIVFLLALAEEAEKAGVTPTHQYLRRVPKIAGFCEHRLPWAAMKVKDRVGHLKERWQAAAKLYKDGKQAEYEVEGAYIYGLLREAWERGVEERLLNGVIERYRNSVQTNRARVLSDISEDDCRRLENGMTKCSRWLAGHDSAAAENAPFPEPGELEKDIKALEEWIDDIRKRRA